ncbi:MAG: glycosyltransferase, partial [Propylenella sp.]
VVLLGRAEGEMAGQLTARIANWACKTTHVANYASHDAVDLLRTEDCLAVLPSRADNLPYTVYECLENGIPFIASAIGGIPEMIREEDRERVLVHGGAEAYAARIIDALTNGFVPAQARFDPTLAEIDLLALHGRLVNDARSLRGGASPATSEATVIVHGADPLDLEGPLARLLWGWARDGVEIVAAADLLSEAAATRLALRGPPVPLADSVGGAALNGLARSATGERLLFCHTSVVPHEGALTAMLTALENTGADAVVCGYEEVDATGKPRAIAVFAGPAELSASENVYGARLMLVRKESFLQAGGFAEEMGLAPIVEWEFLNRLKAGGKRVVGVPLPLAGRSSAPSPELTESGRARLALPWITAAPVNMQGFLAMSLHQAGQPGRRKAAQPNLRLPPEQTPESAGLSRAVSARDAQPSVPTTILDRLPGRAGPQTLHVAATEPSAAEGADIDLSRDDQPPHSRIGRDGRLLDGSVTYVVSAAEDAEACDFLVADGLLGRDQCKTLAKTFRSLAGRLFNGSAPRGNLFLWLDEIAAADPSAGRTIADALERAATLTRDFYGIDGPIYPVRSRIVEVPAGRFIPPPARALGSVNGSGPFGYAGGIRLNQDFEGGESYFPALDIAVKPKRGRLMTAAADPQHEHAVLRVTSGAQLMMTFCLTSMPRDASDSVKRTVYS